MKKYSNSAAINRELAAMTSNGSTAPKKRDPQLIFCIAVGALTVVGIVAGCIVGSLPA